VVSEGIPRCPVCAEKQTEFLGRRGSLSPIDGYARFVERLEPFDRDIFRCCSCGLQFIHPTYDEMDLQDLYGTHRYELFLNTTSDMGDPETSETISFVKRLKSGLIAKGISLWREEFLRRHGRNPRFLDIGCGRGGNLWAFHDLGFDVMGIDMSRENVRFVKDRLKFEAVHTSLNEFTAQVHFDCILASHVIEHFACPHTFMDDAIGLLSDEGLLILYTPLTDDWGNEEHRYRDIYHTLFFDHFSLALLAAMHGMVCRYMSTTFFRQNSNIANVAGIFVRDGNIAGKDFSPGFIRALRPAYESVRKDFLMLIRDRLATPSADCLPARVRRFYREHGFLATVREILHRSAAIFLRR
jgi:SAM-dependent methyltransferase